MMLFTEIQCSHIMTFSVFHEKNMIFEKTKKKLCVFVYSRHIVNEMN